jgi:hypothetical protein
VGRGIEMKNEPTIGVRLLLGDVAEIISFAQKAALEGKVKDVLLHQTNAISILHGYFYGLVAKAQKVSGG